MTTFLTAEDMQSEGIPEMACLMVSLIGPDTTATLINQLGGTTFPVSKNKRHDGQIRHALLAEVVGEREANILTRHFGGEVISIPRCSRLLQLKRNRQLRAEFDRLCREYSASAVATMLGIRYRMTERNVWNILKES